MLETECIDHAGCIIGEPCDVERFPIVSRATDPAVVDEDQLVEDARPSMKEGSQSAVVAAKPFRTSSGRPFPTRR